MNFPPTFWSSIEWFEESEWKQDPSKASLNLIRAMDLVREATLRVKPPHGVPIYIHECWAPDGHSPRSYHYTGQAVDFHFGPGLSYLEELLLLVKFNQFGGIGFYPKWKPRPGWHVDMRNYNSNGRLYWFYHSALGYQYGASALAHAVGNAIGVL